MPKNEETLETSEQLESEIAALQAKLVKAQTNEDGETVELVETPTADVVVLVGGKSTVTKTGVTPAEVAILVAEHHVHAGGMPIKHITLTGKKNMNPVIERERLSAIYGKEKVKALFPGMIPTFPKSFRSAMNQGIEAEMPSRRLMDFNLATP